jgi:hypothetical protein
MPLIRFSPTVNASNAEMRQALMMVGDQVHAAARQRAELQAIQHQ